MEETRLPRVKSKGLVTQESGDELLIFALETSKACCLNRPAVAVMHLCDGKTTFSQAAAKLGMGEDLVRVTVDSIGKAGLLASDLTDGYSVNLSRRRVLRQAAAFGIAVPVVASLVAPSALHAASNCIPLNQTCTQNGTPCCTGTACFNTESGPTGFTCIGCTAPGQPCSVGTACCNGTFCVSNPTGPKC